MEYANLSVDEIQQQLEDIEMSKAELRRALEQRRQEAKLELAEQIRELIAQHGYEIDDIVPLIVQRRRRAATATRKSGGNRQYTRFVDPQNPDNVYVRGVLPGWMKQKMQEQGFDPSAKADREAFKASYLQVIEG